MTQAQNRHRDGLADAVIRELTKQIVDTSDRLSGKGQDDIASAESGRFGGATGVDRFHEHA